MDFLGVLINIWFNIIYFIRFVILLVFNIALVMNFWYIFGCIYLYFMHTNSIIYLFEMSQYLAMLLCCADQLRAQSLAIVDKNSKTGCPEGLRPVDTLPRTNWIKTAINRAGPDVPRPSLNITALRSESGHNFFFFFLIWPNLTF